MTKLYSVALNYQVWIDVEAKDEIDAIYYARNANFNLDLKQGENNSPNITFIGVEYNDIEPLVYEYPD